METVVTGNDDQDPSELAAHTTRINELVANMIKQEIYLKKELATKKEDIASLTASLDNSNKEIAEFQKQRETLQKQIETLQKQIAEMRKTSENNQTLIGELRSLVAEQEMQLKNLKEVIGTKEQVITSFAVSLENSKKEIEKLHKQKDVMKPTNENKESLIRESKEKIDSLSEVVSLLTNRQSKQKAKEENSVQKADRKTQKKMLKRLLNQHPKANEKELADLLAVDISYIIQLRKEFDI
ncbi:hypothetical protein [Bacillus salipaludis]|uniref:Uncharacterized protein n=1 Tax=Bacillus salipaludis TaxID=2547811 RepID=A0ABW8RP10_9BACI